MGQLLKNLGYFLFQHLVTLSTKCLFEWFILVQIFASKSRHNLHQILQKVCSIGPWLAVLEVRPLTNLRTLSGQGWRS